MRVGSQTTNPGEMRTQVVIKKRAVSQDAGGFPAAAYATTVATVWAKWVNAHGAEVWAAQQAKTTEAATVRIRWRSDVDETCALQKGGVLFEIVSMDNIQERGEYLELKVRRMVKG